MSPSSGQLTGQAGSGRIGVPKRILLCLSHSIEEYDQLKLLSGLGYDVASLGGYINPHTPHDDVRPALPEVMYFPEVQRAVDEQNTDDNLGHAQAWIPDAILEWLGPGGIIIFHHYLDRLYGQWDHLREFRQNGGRIIWRTVGQSVEHNERQAAPYRHDGMEIVRYSPQERNIPGYQGSDALIRFYKDPDEYAGWNGEGGFVTNVTQNLVSRERWCNADFYVKATEGLPAQPAGPGSEALPGGLGKISEEGMKHLLQDARCYMYTGTQPASYTLGLIEALMTGVPVVSIGPSHFDIFPYGKDLFEGYMLSPFHEEDPAEAKATLQVLLNDADIAARVSQHQRHRAIQEFGKDRVAEAWATYLGR